MKRILACGVAAGLLVGGQARAMDKDQLLNAAASRAKLTKADAGRVLDAFTATVGGKLKKGDRVSLVGFGSFSVSKRVASANGCASETEIDFSSSASFAAKKEEGGRHTPFHNKIARILPQADGTIIILGPNDGALVSKGEPVIVYNRKGTPVAGISGGVIAGIVVAARQGGGFEIKDSDSGPIIRGTALGGVARTALEIGGSIVTLPAPVFDDPIGACPADGYDGNIATDADIIKGIADLAPGVDVVGAYDALLDTIVETVNNHDFVDAGGLGRFVEQELISATVSDDPCAGLPENCPPTGSASTAAPYFTVDVAVDSGAVTESQRQGLEDTLKGIADQAAQAAGNPQTGKAIQIKAKKVAKFKAGAELAATVNK